MGKRKLRRGTSRPGADAASKGNGSSSRSPGSVLGVSSPGGIDKDAVLSRGKRKRSVRRERLVLKKKFVKRELSRVSSEPLKHGSKKASVGAKRRHSSLSSMRSLADALNDAEAEIRRRKTLPEQRVLHSGGRTRLVVTEAAQMQQVREHPAFQADAMAALREHLINSIGEDPLSVPPVPVPKPSHGKQATMRGTDSAAVPKIAGSKANSVRQFSGYDSQRTRKNAMVHRRTSTRDRVGMASKTGVAKNSRGRIGEKRPKI